MKPTESAAPESRLQGFRGRMPKVGAAVVLIATVQLATGLLPGRERRARTLPVRCGRLVARRPHRHHRRPSRRARPRPLVGRHRIGRRPHPRRPAALRLGARRPGQPRRRRPRRDRPPAPLAAGAAARRGGHPRHRRRRPWSSPRSATCPPSRRPGSRATGASTPSPRSFWSPPPISSSPASCSGTHAPRSGGGLPTVARTALLRQGLVAVALLGIAPLICVVAIATPVLLPLFAVPLIALDSTLWIARARAEEQLRDPLTGLPNRQWLLERTWTALDDAETHRRPIRARPDRPRPLPFGQRHPRPSRGGPAAAADSGPAPAGPAARSGGRAARRRRVRRTAADRRLHDRRPARRPPSGRRARLTARPRRPHAGPGGQRRASPSSPTTRWTPRGCCGGRTWRCTRRSGTVRASRCTSPSGTATPRTGSACSATCAARWTPATWSSTTSRRSASTARWPGSRRWCAGCTRSAAGSRRTSSSPSPSPPG